MAGSEIITVSMRELDRLKTVQAVVDGQLRPGVAAERLEITDRQFRRLLERYRQEGPSGWSPSSAAAPARLLQGADPDRRQRSPLVRGARADRSEHRRLGPIFFGQFRPALRFPTLWRQPRTRHHPAGRP